MPTGYTYQLLNKKQTFPQFAMSCARNFGALIMMRDDPMDAEIPEGFDPSDYYTKSLRKAERELARLKKMTPKERREFGAKVKARKGDYAIKSLRELREQNATLQAMRNEVQSWTPPTEEHTGLHKFMIDQLDMSIEDECWRKDSIVEAAMKSPMDFYKERVEALKREIEYSKKGHTEEIELTASRNDWVKQLRDSLPTQ